MVEINVRKYHTLIDETWHEGGPPAIEPIRAAAVLAVVENPYAGHYEPDITPMMEALKPLGLEMSRRLIDALGGDPGLIEAYGKGAIVGEAGELEHCALWHVPGGYAMRARLGAAKAIVPSSMKVGGVGTRIDIPLGHINAGYVRSHFDGMEIGVPDGPRANELLFALAMSRGPRIHHRMGGLDVADVVGEDGLR